MDRSLAQFQLVEEEQSKNRSTSELGSSVNDDHDNDDLKRTYKKALSDYSIMCQQLETHMTLSGNNAQILRSKLDEREEKASKLLSTLHKYREDIAKQCSFANGRPLSSDVVEELLEKDKSMDIESLRLKQITNKVNVAQLEEKLRQKNEMAGGVSDVEFNNLRENIRKSEEKIASYNTEIQRMVHDRDKFDKLEEFLSKAMKDYTDKNDEKEHELIELNAEIDEKRKTIEGLSRMALKVKNEIGYDASDIGAILSSNKVNNDFASSKDELSALHAKFNSLVSQHKAALIESN